MTTSLCSPSDPLSSPKNPLTGVWPRQYAMRGPARRLGPAAACRRSVRRPTAFSRSCVQRVRVHETVRPDEPRLSALFQQCQCVQPAPALHPGPGRARRRDRDHHGHVQCGRHPRPGNPGGAPGPLAPEACPAGCHGQPCRGVGHLRGHSPVWGACSLLRFLQEAARANFPTSNLTLRVEAIGSARNGTAATAGQRPPTMGAGRSGSRCRTPPWWRCAEAQPWSPGSLAQGRAGWGVGRRPH